MNKLTQAILARLDGDLDLTVTHKATVWLDRQPDMPQALQGPAVVVGVLRDVDRDGEHGGAADVVLEIKVWGYQTQAGTSPTDLPRCLEVAQRITELMLRTFNPVGGGHTARPGSEGWQRVDDTDPQIVHLSASFGMLYWSVQRVSALTS